MTNKAYRHSGTAVYEPDKAADDGFGVERWEGDHTYVEGMWPHEKIPLNEHVHIAPCGGYFNHVHNDGGKPHTHTHLECEWCRRNSV
jgi:hypothetical protein